MENITIASAELEDYLSEVKILVLEELQHNLPVDKKHTGDLYRIMMDYPMRGGKALRPALCIASCQALGGTLRSSLHTAAILELYHNAFLIHDDVQDGSTERRNKETLHSMYGEAIAINVGDGMLSICIQMMLANVSITGVGKSMRIIETISRMSQETAEGQMLELQAIRSSRALGSEQDYVRLVHKKTGWYSFIAPLIIGSIIAGRDQDLAARLHNFGSLLGVAFQIKDDLLNLKPQSEGKYGKEENGDLWEGKYTLMLIYLLQRATVEERRQVNDFLQKSRPKAGETDPEWKTETEVNQIRELMDHYECLDEANEFALRYARKAQRTFHELIPIIGQSRHSDFIDQVINYVLARDS